MVNQIGKPTSRQSEPRTTSRRARTKNVIVGQIRSLAMRSPTEEPPRIKNVGHKTPNSHPPPGRWWPKRIDLRPRYFPQCSTWNTIRAYEQYCVVCRVACGIRYGACAAEPACGLLRHSKWKQCAVLLTQILFGICATRDHGGGSLMFQVEHFVLWTSDHWRHLCR